MHNNSFYMLFSFFHLSEAVLSTREHQEVQNANYVFNAIHSSMRQWGSSLNHNGMSFFTATVPAGTQLYHGTSEPDPIQGMQWLAFEPEHALLFARPNRDPPPDNSTNTNDHYEQGRKDIPKPQPYEEQDPADIKPCESSQLQVLPRPHMRNNQQPFARESPKRDRQTGYLHTYVPVKDLHFLYIDGLSAWKTNNGTLDTQDKLLLNLSPPKHDDIMRREFVRARGMCNLSDTIWEGKVDGILRMEGGFEIILCDFEKHLQRTDLIATTQGEKHGNPRRGGFLGGWPYIRAVTSRYHGIGGGRVKLDYENFISIFAYPGTEGLFSNDVQSDYAMPRLQNVKDADLVRIRNDVTEMILSKHSSQESNRRDWQLVADAVVTRYSTPLHYLHTNEALRNNSEVLEEYLTRLLSPFIQYSDRNETTETQRCVAQLIPPLRASPNPPACLAHRAVHAVTHHICAVLLTSLSTLSRSQTHTTVAQQVTEMIDALVDYLQWTTWKDCGACTDDKICFIPIWPLGNHEDHAQPRCRDAEAIAGRSAYWGSAGMGMPPGKHEKGHTDDALQML